MSFFFGQQFFNRSSDPDAQKTLDAETSYPNNDPPYDVFDSWYSKITNDCFEDTDDQETLLEHLTGEHGVFHV